MMQPLEDGKLVGFAKAKSPVWGYFGFQTNIDGSADKSKAICTLCGNPVRHCGNTTNLVTHLRKWHPEIKISLNTVHRHSVVAPSTVSSSSTTSHNASASTSCVNATKATKNNAKELKYHEKHVYTYNERITDAVTNFIIKDLQPMSTIESPAFNDLVQTLEPKYQLPPREVFETYIFSKKYTDLTVQIVAELDKAEDGIAITLEQWTSVYNQSFITLAAHVLTSDWKLRRFVLQTWETEIDNETEYAKQCLESCLSEWNLAGRHTIAVTEESDLLSSIATACNCSHVICLGHAFQEAVNKCFNISYVSDVLNNVRKLVSFFINASTNMCVFDEKQLLLGLPKNELIIDEPTQWTSTHDMLVRFTEQELTISAAFKDSSLKDKAKEYMLASTEIGVIEDLIDVLKPLKLATLALCEEKVPTLSMILPLVCQILRTVQNKEDTSLKSQMMQAIAEDLKNRYQEVNKMRDTLCTASVLDPRFKSMFFISDTEKDAVTSSVIEKLSAIAASGAVEKAVNTSTGASNIIKSEPIDEFFDEADNLTAIYAEVNGGASHSSTNGPSSTKKSKTDTTFEETTSSALDCLFKDICPTKSDTKTPYECASFEMYKYMAEESISIKEDPLEWWKGRQSIYPLISKLAKRYFCVPATFLPAIKMFTESGMNWAMRRSALTGEDANKLLFLSDNL